MVQIHIFQETIEPGQVFYTSTLEEAQEIIEQYEVDNNLMFVRQVSRGDFGKSTIGGRLSHYTIVMGWRHCGVGSRGGSA